MKNCQRCREAVLCEEMQGGMGMLRLTVNTEEYLMIGDDIKIVFLGGSRNHTRVMLDIPKEVNVLRGKVLEAKTIDPEEKKKLPHYHAEPELPDKYRKKRIKVNDSIEI